MLLKLFLLLKAACVLSATLDKTCPEGAVPTLTNKDKCYMWTKTTDDNDPSTTYNLAESECNKKGGHLTSIPNAQENEYLFELLAKEASDWFYWIGINSIGSQPRWKWEDGTPVNYTNLEVGQIFQQCGSFYLFEGNWEPIECKENLNYICLIPAILPITTDAKATMK